MIMNTDFRTQFKIAESNNDVGTGFYSLIKKNLFKSKERKTVDITVESKGKRFFSEQISGIVPKNTENFQRYFSDKTFIPISLKNIQNNRENNQSSDLEIIFVKVNELMRIGFGEERIKEFHRILSNQNSNQNVKIEKVQYAIKSQIEKLVFFKTIHDTLIDKWSAPIDPTLLETVNEAVKILPKTELTEEQRQILIEGRVGGSETILNNPEKRNDWTTAERFIRELAKTDAYDLTIDDFCTINTLINGDSVDEFSGELVGGNLRDHTVQAGGPRGLSYIHQDAVKALVIEIIDEIKEKINEENPIVLAATSYQKLVSIHPFSDGNGRTCRLVMDYILLKAQIVPPTLADVNLAIFGDPPSLFERGDRDITPSLAVEKVFEGILNSYTLINDVITTNQDINQNINQDVI